MLRAYLLILLHLLSSRVSNPGLFRFWFLIGKGSFLELVLSSLEVRVLKAAIAQKETETKVLLDWMETLLPTYVLRSLHLFVNMLLWGSDNQPDITLRFYLPDLFLLCVFFCHLI